MIVPATAAVPRGGVSRLLSPLCPCRLPTQRPLRRQRGLLKMPSAVIPLCSDFSTIAHRSGSHPASQRGPRGPCNVCHPPAPCRSPRPAPCPLSPPLASSPLAPTALSGSRGHVAFHLSLLLLRRRSPSILSSSRSQRMLRPRGGVSGPLAGATRFPCRERPWRPVLLLHCVRGA